MLLNSVLSYMLVCNFNGKTTQLQTYYKISPTLQGFFVLIYLIFTLQKMYYFLKKGYNLCILILHSSYSYWVDVHVITLKLLVILNLHWYFCGYVYWKLQCLQPVLVNRKDPILCDNAWLHIAQPILQKLNELGY